MGIVIASISLGFAIWQGREQIRFNHVTVEPRINAYFSSDRNKKLWGIYVVNNGMGPAFVTDIAVTVDGKPVKAVDNNIFIGAVQALGLKTDCFAVGGPRPGDSFKTGEETPLIEARGTDEDCASARLALMVASRRLDFTLDTESIYGDKFRYRYEQNVQHPR